MDYQIEAISHSFYNAKKHTNPKNRTKGLMFNLRRGNEYYEYRAQEVYAESIRLVCSNAYRKSQEINELTGKPKQLCSATIKAIPLSDRIPIRPKGERASGSQKLYEIDPDIPWNILKDPANWTLAHNHSARCENSIDENGQCRLMKHSEYCKPGGSSKNSEFRPLQREARQRITALGEANIERAPRDVIKSGLEAIPELVNQDGVLVANAPELRGIRKRNERAALKHIRGQVNLIPGSDIPQRYEKMSIDYPMTFAGNQILQRRDMKYIHIEQNMILFFLEDDLRLINDERCFFDGTFKACAYSKEYYQLVTIAIKMESADSNRSFAYPVVRALLANKQEATYDQFWSNVKKHFERAFPESELNISKIHMDQVSFEFSPGIDSLGSETRVRESIPQGPRLESGNRFLRVQDSLLIIFFT